MLYTGSLPTTCGDWRWVPDPCLRLAGACYDMQGQAGYIRGQGVDSASPDKDVRGQALSPSAPLEMTEVSVPFEKNISVLVSATFWSEKIP